MIRKIITYPCLKCGHVTSLELRVNMTDRTLEVFRDMFDAKLCLDCHCDTRIPELVECLVN